MTTILQTERLALRELCDGDTENVRRMLSDSAAQRFFAHVVERPGFPEEWIRRNRDRYRSDGFGLWAIEDRETGAFLGDCGLTRQTLDDGESLVEVGYHLAASARGRGIATEAARACLSWGFGRLEVEWIGSMVHVDNEASRRVAERIHRHCREGLRKNGLPIRLFFTRREDLAPSPS